MKDENQQPNETRLDLSEFENDVLFPRRAPQRPAPRESPGQSTVPSVAAIPEEQSPTFVPVGFHKEHLEKLDRAVFDLRQLGCRKASKSALIRLLIERHLSEVVQDYKDDHTPRRADERTAVAPSDRM